MDYTIKAQSPAVAMVTGICNATKDFNLLLTSDQHFDHRHCDRKLLKDHFDEAKQKEAGIVINGDWFCAMQGKFDIKRSDKSALLPQYQVSNYLDAIVEDSYEFLKPYVDNLVLIGRGNHETAITKIHETDLTDRLCFLLRTGGSQVVAGGYAGWIRLVMDSGYTNNRSSFSYNFKFNHGYGGGSRGTKGVNQYVYNSKIFPDADCIMSGHTHDAYILENIRERLNNAGNVVKDTQYWLRTPTYKDEWHDGTHGYAVERNYAPTPMGGYWFNMSVHSGKPYYEFKRTRQ